VHSDALTGITVLLRSKQERCIMDGLDNLLSDALEFISEVLVIQNLPQAPRYTRMYKAVFQDELHDDDCIFIEMY
jgi:hypothetical protein